MKQWKYIKKILTPKEKFIWRFCLSVMSLAVIFILANSYFTFTKVLPAYGGEYTEGLVGSPQFVNPILSANNDVDQDITSLIYNGLVKHADKAGMQPDLAQTYTVSDDQKTYTFILREDVYWHDGEKFSADDVVLTFERIKDPASRSPLYFTFKGVTVEKIDNKTVRFVLSQPFAPFIESLTVGIVPNHVWSRVPVANTSLSEFNLKPIGTGPFKFDSLEKDNHTGEIRSYSLIRNEGYFNRKAYIKKINFKFYPSFDQAVDAVNNKNIEGLSYLPKNQQAEIIHDSSINFHKLNLPQYTALFYNPKKNSLLADSKIRKLLAHGVNKDRMLNEILLDQAQRIDSPILPGQVGYTTDFAKYPFDIEYAKGELDKIGWKAVDYVIEKPEPKEGETPAPTESYPFQVRQKNKTYLEVQLTTVNQAESIKIAELIQKDWQAMGIKTNIKIIQPEEIQKEVITDRNYEILLYSELIGFDPDPFPFWHSSQIAAPGLNLAMFANSKADGLLDKARQTTDAEKRAQYYIDFQKILADEMPAVFLFNPTYTYPQNKKIRGFATETIISPSNRFSNVTDWFIKIDRSFK